MPGPLHVPYDRRSRRVRAEVGATHLSNCIGIDNLPLLKHGRQQRPTAERTLALSMWSIAPPGPVHLRGGVACYLYVGPLGHKPSKRISAVTNPINPCKPERLSILTRPLFATITHTRLLRYFAKTVYNLKPRVKLQ